jgi:methylated-DNA-[protein]-cysteine S-methyltransferase
VQVLGYAVPGWGRGELWVDGERVFAHELPRPRASGVQRAAASSERRVGPVSPLQQRVLAYFGGEREEFRDVELDLDWCTPFQRAVAEALRTVPYGETVTYGELAALAGHPNAHRAAGSFCAGNRFGLFVPCHRVVAAGSLGSYGSLGVEYKRRLLALEGATAATRCRARMDPDPTGVGGAADAP